MGATGRAAAALVGALGLALASAGAGSTQVLPAPDAYRNPVVATDFPDPFVLRADGGWYAFATHRSLANIQVARSTDLATWHDVGTALPFLPAWAAGPEVWAPSALARPGGYVLYYSVQEAATGRFCVSRATSGTAAGPYLDGSSGPLVCQRERGGTIDPSPFVDADGRAYLLFKSEGVVGHEHARLWSQPLRADGLALEGEPAELLAVGAPWEGDVIENPAMVRAPDGGHHLLYSANEWESPDYAVGWATCDSPLGPCRRGQDGPLLRSRDWALGPGGADVFVDVVGDPWVAYHAWTTPATTHPEGRRSLMIDRIAFAAGRLVVAGPSTTPVRFADRPPLPDLSALPVPPPAVAAADAPAARASSSSVVAAAAPTPAAPAPVPPASVPRIASPPAPARSTRPRPAPPAATSAARPAPPTPGAGTPTAPLVLAAALLVAATGLLARQPAARAYAGSLWQTASTLLPSGSRTNPP